MKIKMTSKELDILTEFIPEATFLAGDPNYDCEDGVMEFKCHNIWCRGTVDHDGDECLLCEKLHDEVGREDDEGEE